MKKLEGALRKYILSLLFLLLICLVPQVELKADEPISEQTDPDYWKMQGYNGTFKALMKGALRKVDNPSEMTFISIENKMYHIGAWKAYREFINLFNEGKEL